jgi:hypothetical protein
MAISLYAQGSVVSDDNNAAVAPSAPTGSNVVLVVFAGSRASGGNDCTLSNLTLDGSPLTALADHASRPPNKGHRRIYCQYKAIPPAGSSSLVGTWAAGAQSSSLTWFTLTNAQTSPPSPFDLTGQDLATGTPFATTDPATIVGWAGDNTSVPVQIVATEGGIVLACLVSGTTADTGVGDWTADSGQVIHGQVVNSENLLFTVHDSKVVGGAGAAAMDISVLPPRTGGRFSARAVVFWPEVAFPGGELDTFFGRIPQGR